jgi:hypothetical protein
MDIEEWETLSTKISLEVCFDEFSGRNLRRITVGNYATRGVKNNRFN